MPQLEYWLQIENHPWDTAPNGFDRAAGTILTPNTDGKYRPLPTDALIIRRCTPNWAAPEDRVLNPWDLTEADPAKTQGTIPGATIEAKVGDTLLVHFRNNDQRPNLTPAQRVHSLHAHGVTHAPLSDGTFPYAPPDPAQANRRADRLLPGESFTYRYAVPHLSTAGIWAYHDGSVNSAESIPLGACGAIVVRAGGEGRPILPSRPLRTAGDTPTKFANIPPPPPVEHLILIHELTGIGTCLNGRNLTGSTPLLLARLNQRVKFRVLNLTARAHTFHLHGHRWRRGDDWTDSENIPAFGGVSLEILQGTAEHGGGNGEWAITIPSAPGLSASIIITEGGTLTL